MPIPGGEITTSEVWTTPEEKTNESNQEVQTQEADKVGEESVLPSETTEQS